METNVEKLKKFLDREDVIGFHCTLCNPESIDNEDADLFDVLTKPRSSSDEEVAGDILSFIDCIENGKSHPYEEFRSIDRIRIR